MSIGLGSLERLAIPLSATADIFRERFDFRNTRLFVTRGGDETPTES